MDGSNQSAEVGGKVTNSKQVKDELSLMQMTTEKRGSLSQDEILTESCKILKGNAWSFLCIQLTLLLPSVILTICVLFLLSSQVPLEYSELFMGEPLQSDTPLTMRWNTLIQLLPFLSMCIMSSVGLLAIYSLSVSANIYAVVLLFDDKAISFAVVLKGAIERLWMRLFATLLCWLMLLGPPILVFAGCHVSVKWISSVYNTSHTMLSTSLYVMLMTVRNLVFGYSIFYGGMIFMLVSAVCVFEENCCWVTLKRAWQLVQGRVAFACRIHLGAFLVDYMVFFFLIGGGLGFFFSQLIEWLPWSTFLVLAGVCLVTYHLQRGCIAVGVTYVSFKAYRDTIGDSSLSNAASGGGYQPLLDNSEDEASLDEPHPDHLV